MEIQFFPIDETLLMAQEPINRGRQQLLASCNSVLTDQFIDTETI